MTIFGCSSSLAPQVTAADPVQRLTKDTRESLKEMKGVGGS